MSNLAASAAKFTPRSRVVGFPEVDKTGKLSDSFDVWKRPRYDEHGIAVYVLSEREVSERSKTEDTFNCCDAATLLGGSTSRQLQEPGSRGVIHGANEQSKGQVRRVRSPTSVLSPSSRTSNATTASGASVSSTTSCPPAGRRRPRTALQLKNLPPQTHAHSAPGIRDPRLMNRPQNQVYATHAQTLAAMVNKQNARMRSFSRSEIQPSPSQAVPQAQASLRGKSERKQPDLDDIIVESNHYIPPGITTVEWELLQEVMDCSWFGGELCS